MENASGCHGELQNAAPAAEQPPVNAPALLVLGKEPGGLTFIAVDLPAAGALVVGAAVVDKALHVSQRVAEKQPNLMGKGVLCAKALAQPFQCGGGAQVGVALTGQKLRNARFAQIMGQPLWPVYINQRAAVFRPQQPQTNALVLQCPVSVENLSGQLLLTAVTAGKQIGGFQIGQCGGTMVDEVTVQRHGGGSFPDVLCG